MVAGLGGIARISTRLTWQIRCLPTAANADSKPSSQAQKRSTSKSKKIVKDIFLGCKMVEFISWFMEIARRKSLC
jgi:hypothetical protein